MSASATHPAPSIDTPSGIAEAVVIHSMSGSSSPATTIIMSTTAQSSNERIFINYETHFKNGVRNNTEGSFAETARKFSDWLKVDRAYYAQARPWIVRLLQTARRTVQRIAGLPEDQPFHVTMCPADLAYWVDAYVLMLRTVQPFDHHFVEDELRGPLAALFRTIAPPLPSRSRQRTVPAPLHIAGANHLERRPQSSSGIASSFGKSGAGSPSVFVQSPFNTDMPTPPRSAPPHGASSSQQPPTATNPTPSWATPNFKSSWRLPSDIVQNLNAMPGAVPPGLPRRSSSSGSNMVFPASGSYPFVPVSPAATQMPFSHSLVSSPTGFAGSFSPPTATSPTRATTFQIPTSPRRSEGISAPQPAPPTSVPLASTSASAPVPMPAPAPAILPTVAPTIVPAPGPGIVPAPAKPKKAKNKRKVDYAFLESDLEWYLEQKEAEKKKAQAEATAQAQAQGAAQAVAEPAPDAQTGTVAAQSAGATDPGAQSHSAAEPLPDPAGGLQMGAVEGFVALKAAVLAESPSDAHAEPKQDVEMTDVEVASVGHTEDVPMVVDAPNDSQPPPAAPTEDVAMPSVQGDDAVMQGELAAAPADAPTEPTEPVSDDNARMEVGTVPTAGQDTTPLASYNAIEGFVQGQNLDVVAPAGQTAPINQSQPAEVTPPPVNNLLQLSHDPQPSAEPQRPPTTQVPAPAVSRIVDLSKVQSPLKPRSKKGASELIVHRTSSLKNPFGLPPSKATPSAPTLSTPTPSAPAPSTPASSAPSAPVASTPTLVPPVEAVASEPGEDNEEGADADDETGGDDDMAPRKNNHWTHKKKHTAAAAASASATPATTTPKPKKGPPGVKTSDLKLPSDTAPTTTPSASEAEREHTHSTVKGNKGRKGPPGIRSAPIGGVPVTPTKRSTSGTSADAAQSSQPRSPLIIRIPSKQARSEMHISSDSEDEEPLAVVVRRASEQRRKASGAAVSSSSASTPAAAESSSLEPPTTAVTEPPSSTVDEASAMELDQWEAETAHQEPVEAAPASAVPKLSIGQFPDLQELLSRINHKLGQVSGTSSHVAANVDWDTINPLFHGISSTARPDEDKYSALPLFNENLVLLSTMCGGSNLLPRDFGFELTEQQVAACELWASRYKHTEDMANARCLSIFCYSFPEIQKENPCEEVFRKYKPIPWPQQPRLQVKINDKLDGHFAVTNYHTPRDNLVDISGDIHTGWNDLSIVPIGGPANHILYAVLLHFPTPRQMGELDWRRNGDRQWQETLKRNAHFPSPLLAHIPGYRADGTTKGAAAS